MDVSESLYCQVHMKSYKFHDIFSKNRISKIRTPIISRELLPKISPANLESRCLT